ncbi:MAG: undecaprenyl-diphosphate phosphatase [bacterium]|nr:undecaprenyl-diphosphate phosphatase [bacterium]
MMLEPVVLAAPKLEIWQAAVLGLVEGITEYLPISSTGHLIVASSLLGLGSTPEQKHAVDSFNIVIQGGAILAVMALYWPRVLRMLKGIAGKDAAGLALAFKLFIAFLPAAVLGLTLDDWLEERLFFPGPVVAAMLVGGVFMLLLDQWRNGRFGLRPRPIETDVADITWKQALAIGCFQCVAMWPGTSRSMMTIAGGVMVGLKPKQAAEFSFLLGLPTLGAATLYKLAKHPGLFTELGFTPCITGILVAAVSAFVAVRWLVGILNRRGLAPFGWYRIVAGLVLLVLVLRGSLTIAPEAKPVLNSQTTIVPWPEKVAPAAR